MYAVYDPGYGVTVGDAGNQVAWHSSNEAVCLVLQSQRWDQSMDGRALAISTPFNEVESLASVWSVRGLLGGQACDKHRALTERLHSIRAPATQSACS